MALFAYRYIDGPAVAVPGPSGLRMATRDQARQRRNALWLRATTEGMTDALSGRNRIHTPAELARMWGVSRQAVRNGIAQAREVRERIRALAVAEN